jgi:hypothetical protein
LKGLFLLLRGSNQVLQGPRHFQRTGNENGVEKNERNELKFHFIVGNDTERLEYIANNLKKWLCIAPRVHTLGLTRILPKYRGQTSTGSKDGIIL